MRGKATRGKARAWLLLAAVLAGACGGASEGQTTGSQPPELPPVEEGAPVDREEVRGVIGLLDEQTPYIGVFFDGAIDVGGISATEMHLSDDSTEPTEKRTFFDPTVVVGDAGQELTLVLTNNGDVFHTFSIEEQGIEMELDPGQTKQVSVTLPSGDAPILFYCRPHDVGGMYGALVARS